jgi:hypothetical protein
MTDFFADLERELRRAHRRDSERHPSSRVFDLRRLLPVRPATGLPALVALAVVVALVAVVVTVARESDVERPAAPPGKKVVATDVERGVRFSLDGRVLTVQLLPNRPNPIETVSGARISATCGANVALPADPVAIVRAPPGDPRSEITLTRLWPAGQTSLSYRFPRDVSSWCLLRDQSGSIVAFVAFPGASPGARGPIAETATKWARLIAASPQTCNDYTGQTACEQITCQRVGGTPIPNCRPIELEWAFTFLIATVQATAISGDRAAATLSNNQTVQLRRTATGEWLIDKLGEDGLPAELRRKLRLPGA